MTRLRGRGCLMIIAMVSFLLLIVIYHIFNSEVEDISSNKVNSHLKLGDMYSIGSNDQAGNVEKKQLESPVMASFKINSKSREGLDKLYTDITPLFKGHRIVHLDLKGAPFKISYYKNLLPLLSKLGATGLLIEYEDMFPFDGNMKNVTAGNCYSLQDVSTIQEIASENNLLIIPLIQTFGHLEFILKLNDYKDYREVMRYPQVLCPTYNKTIPLLHDMIDQVVAAHPELKYLHIGADEVYQIGECSRCLELMAKRKWGKRQLFLDHVTRIVRYISGKYPHLTILMWDDEFREISPQEIIDRGLHKLVEPVVWKYTTDPGSSLTDQLWESYAAVWKNIWVATAFKGATYPDRYYVDISYHQENHQRWLEIINKYSDQINFKGAILTGWQRYDHFSVLCELLPSALPSLAICLNILQASDLNGFPIQVPRPIMDALQCEGEIQLTVQEPQYGWAKCSYLGVEVYKAILRLFLLVQDMNRIEQDNTYKGWLKPYNIKYAFSSPAYVERALVDLDKFKMEIIYIEKDIRSAMEEIYDNYTAQEWLETYLVPLNDRVNELWDAKIKILDKNSWPSRPLTKPEL
ncbi:hexosaminidase D-like [Prorops nasuta]|uniref:hexosaminidase D-like n=1 Tax=Prorops nasuta TaxID=863751 RepID=UPI0034CEF60E